MIRSERSESLLWLLSEHGLEGAGPESGRLTLTAAVTVSPPQAIRAGLGSECDGERCAALRGVRRKR